MSLTKEKATEYLGKLMSIRMNGPLNPRVGICCNLSPVLTKDISQFMGVCREWEHFSGCTSYPIPVCKTYDSELGRERLYHGDSDLWDDSTEYGALRWELVDFLIEFWSEKIEDWDYWTEKYDGWKV